MTEKFYIKRGDTSSCFGGRIYESDFNGHISLADMAARIESDWRFDQACKMQGENLLRLRRLKQQLNKQ